MIKNKRCGIFLTQRILPTFVLCITIFLLRVFLNQQDFFTFASENKPKTEQLDAKYSKRLFGLFVGVRSYGAVYPPLY